MSLHQNKDPWTAMRHKRGKYEIEVTVTSELHAQLMGERWFELKDRDDHAIRHK